MAWGQIVVGIDASPAAKGAAIVGERVARTANVPCRLVHAVRDAWAPLVAVSVDPQVEERQQLQLAVGRYQINDLLGAAVSEQTRQTLDARFGPAVVVLERDVWPLVKTPGVEKLVRHGHVVETLLREAADWKADVLVVGSHGKGWAQRVLLGSVTERLINQLPASLLVAPVGVAAAALSQSRERQFELAQ